MVDFAAHTANIINRIGRPVTLTPSGGPAREVNAVFSVASSEAFGLVSGFSPTLRVLAADSEDIAPGDAVSVGVRSYVVASVDDDSLDSGDRVLRLEAP